MKFALLPYPHHNSRYANSQRGLLKAEFEVLRVGGELPVGEAAYEDIGGVTFLTFEGDLDDTRRGVLGRLSLGHVLFTRDGALLSPLRCGGRGYFSADMSGILKYKGKTNERFTRLMINVGLFSSAFAQSHDTALSLLDPMAGRGTTLYEGLMMGYNVAGIEKSGADVSEAVGFMLRYLKYHRLKHTHGKQSVGGGGKKGGVKHLIETADTIAHFKEGARRTATFALGDTRDANAYYKKSSFHLVVTDIPYGVQHKGAGKGGVSMEGLLEEALPAWHKVMKTGGAVVLSFNTHAQKRPALTALFERAGFAVRTGAPYDSFEHWVEQAVNRDLIVAIKR